VTSSPTSKAKSRRKDGNLATSSNWIFFEKEF